MLWKFPVAQPGDSSSRKCQGPLSNAGREVSQERFPSLKMSFCLNIIKPQDVLVQGSCVVTAKGDRTAW